MLEEHGVEMCKHLEAIQLFENVGSFSFFFFFLGAGWKLQQHEVTSHPPICSQRCMLKPSHQRGWCSVWTCMKSGAAPRVTRPLPPSKPDFWWDGGRILRAFFIPNADELTIILSYVLWKIFWIAPCQNLKPLQLILLWLLKSMNFAAPPLQHHHHHHPTHPARCCRW